MQMAEGEDIAEVGSRRADMLYGHSQHLYHVLKGPAGLSCSHSFSSLLDSHQPMTSVFSLDNNLLMGIYDYSSLFPQQLSWCLAYSLSSLNISCIQERRIDVCYLWSR